MLGPKILYENDGLLAIDKPAGLLVHHAPRYAGAEPTVVDWLRSVRPGVGQVGDDPRTRPGIVHRLDRDTSGVMVIAKTQEMFERIKREFQTHRVQKTYLAVVRGKIGRESGRIDAPIGIIHGTTRRSVRATKMAKTAVTEYVTRGIHAIGPGQWVSVLAVMPRTGRTHQIRVHLASIGHPVLGDMFYDRRRNEPPKAPRLLLHAVSIAFEAGPGERLELEAPVPPEFLSYLSTPAGVV